MAAWCLKASMSELIEDTEAFIDHYQLVIDY